MGEGRLTAAEFDERMSSALQARTLADLTPLFEDLPEPHPVRGVSTGPALVPTPLGAPAQPAPMAPTGRGVAKPEGKLDLSPQAIMGTVTGVAWAVAVILLVTGVAGWWVFLVPVLLLPALGNLLRNPDKNKGIEPGRNKHES